MSWIIVSFFLGTLLFQLFSTIPSLLLFSLLILLFIVSATILVIFNKLFNSSLKIILAFIFGLTWEFVNFLFVSSWELPKNFEGQNITVAGFVTSLPEFKAGNQFGKKQIVESFDFSTTEIAEVKQRTKIILNWYDPSAKVIAGDKWQFKVRLKRPHGIKNLGGFDFEKYLLQNKIRASGYIVSGNENIFLNDRSAKYFLMKLRQKLREKALLIFDQSSISGIIIALILGDESGIDKKQWQVFRDTGTSYLLAISGLHIGLVALAVYYLFGFIWKSFPRLVLFYPTTKAATFLGMIAAFFYGALSGFSIPTQRALIMLALFALGILQSKEIIAYRSLLLALFFVLLIDPFSPLMVGFWLSFAAVAFIIFVSSGRKSLVNSWWKKYWRMQIAVTLGLLPLSLLLFGQVSFISLFANLFALPLVCSVIVPISLIGFHCRIKINGNSFSISRVAVTIALFKLASRDFSQLDFGCSCNWYVIITCSARIFGKMVWSYLDSSINFCKVRCSKTKRSMVYGFRCGAGVGYGNSNGTSCFIV